MEKQTVRIFTTAPESYDYQGESVLYSPPRVQASGMDSGAPLRVFTTDEHTAAFQVPRYQSGLYIATTDEGTALDLTRPAD